MSKMVISKKYKYLVFDDTYTEKRIRNELEKIISRGLLLLIDDALIDQVIILS